MPYTFKLKKTIATFLTVTFLLTNPIITYGSEVDNILYNKKETQTITSGVTYEKDIRLTQAGWLDIHTMKVDLTNPYVNLDVVRSVNNFGSKEALTNLIKDNDAIAGINADFFNMAHNPTDTMGFEYEDNKIGTAKHNLNAGSNSQGSLFIDTNDKAFIDFMKVQMIFYDDNNRKLYVSGINRVTDLSSPVCFNTQAMSSTKQIDALYPNLSKIVVENDIVKYISKPGETVAIPENGYIISMDDKTATYHINAYPVGTKVTFDITTNIDLDSIKLAISGGGKIVENGNLINTGLVVQGNQRHPRSAIGYSADKNTLYMVVVDGRGSSIGVTHEEFGKILLSKGVYEAIHLDGGGSSTLVGRTLGTDDLAVLNKTSDGTQRRIPNGLGIYSTAPQGQLMSINIMATSTKVFKDTPITFKVVGYDQYFNPVAIDDDDIIWQTSNLNGRWEGNTFYPLNTGKGTIRAYVKGVSSHLSIESLNDPISMEIDSRYIFLEPGESKEIKVMGVDKEGYRRTINSKNINWEIEDDTLGHFYGGRFVAGTKNGYSLIKGSIGDTVVYGYVIINNEKVTVDSFENANIQTIAYPSTVTAGSELIDGVAHDGQKAINLVYSFAESTQTQAAYVQLNDPYEFENKLEKIGLWVKGNNLNQWLRGRITDSKGDTYNITFSSQVNWEGWKYVESKLPSDISYPIKLDRVYIASLYNNQPVTSNLVFDELTAIYSVDTSNMKLPKEAIINDPLYSAVDSSKGTGFALYGSTAGKNRILDKLIQSRVIKKMDEVAQVSLFAGYTELNDAHMSNDKVVWQDQYEIIDYEDIRIINLATSKNGMRMTDAEQWKNFENDLKTTSQEHIIIMTNKNPLDKSGFTDTREGELLHQLIRDYKEESGKNIFVVDGSGYDFNVELYEGIRYFDINGLWYNIYQEDNMQKVNLNETQYIIKFNVDDSNISYNIMEVYPKIIE